MSQKLSTSHFYNEYHGHTKKDLQTLLALLKSTKGLNDPEKNKKHHFIYLVGDSSFDNKYWSLGHTRACNGYENVLDNPSKAVPDIAWSLNSALSSPQSAPFLNGHTYTVINCAVEESTIGERLDGKLFPQDEFVRDNITSNDILMCSLGGNDVALKASKATMAAMAWLAKVSWTSNIKDGSAWGLGHFYSLFHEEYEKYLLNVTSSAKPMAIIPCMIYYLCEDPKQESWANRTLSLLGYDNPAGCKHLQNIIDGIYQLCMVRNPYKIPGTKIIPVELSKALDGKDPKMYDNRVEPSRLGGVQVANLLSSTVIKFMQQMEEEKDLKDSLPESLPASFGDGDDKTKKKFNKSKAMQS